MPSSWWTRTTYSLPVSRRTQIKFGLLQLLTPEHKKQGLILTTMDSEIASYFAEEFLGRNLSATQNRDQRPGARKKREQPHFLRSVPRKL
jgi:hypothetical protein